MLCRNYENVYLMADAHAPPTWEQSLIDYLNGGGRHNVDGTQKVMWGTDWPMQQFTESLRQVEELGLDPEIKAALIGGNAERILNL